jgi:hypothetical protein
MLNAKLMGNADEGKKWIVQKQRNQQKADGAFAEGAAAPESNSRMLHALHSSTNIV